MSNYQQDASVNLRLSRDGKFYAEAADANNGSRIKINLPEDFYPGREIMEILLSQREKIIIREQIEKEKTKNAQAQMHSKVWTTAAWRHGVAFAEKTIGKRNTNAPAPLPTKQFINVLFSKL